MLVVGLMVVFWIFSMMNPQSGFNSIGSSGEVAPSTVEREPLPEGSVNETEYYTDTAGWISNESQMTDGLEYFYEETGVQPHVFITETLPSGYSMTLDDLDALTNELYEELFTDEAHLLLFFHEAIPDEYTTYYLAGTQAQQVIDNEAGNILLDYLDRHYYDSSLTDEEYFSKSFRDAADRIMEVTTSPWIPVFIVVGIVVALGLLFMWWRQKQARDEAEAKRTEEILSRPIDRFGSSSDISDLEKKYSDDNDESTNN